MTDLDALVRLADAATEKPSLVIETYLTNGRLQMNMDIGPGGIDLLRKMLAKYEEILRLANEPEALPDPPEDQP